MLTTVILAVALTVPGEAELKAWLPDIFAKSAAHYKALDAAATPLAVSDCYFLEALVRFDKSCGVCVARALIGFSGLGQTKNEGGLNE